MDKLEIKPAFNENNVPLVIYVSNFYAPYAGVFLKSLIDHADPFRNYDIIILQKDISFENRRLLTGMADGFQNISIRIPDSSPLFQRLSECTGNGRFPQEIYVRNLAPYYLKCYEKIIVTGVDTLLREDIALLYDYEFDKNISVGGVPDALVLGQVMQGYIPNVLNGKEMSVGRYLKEILHLKTLSKYINADCLVINREKYIETIPLPDLVEIIQTNSFALTDQDVLNTIFRDKISFIDAAWNVMIPTSESSRKVVEAVLQKDEWGFRKANESPCMLHWISRPKPWICPDVPYGGEWWKTAMTTPFVGEIIARMQDGLLDRKKYYISKYDAEVQAWDPAPMNVDRSGNYSGENK